MKNKEAIILVLLIFWDSCNGFANVAMHSYKENLVPAVNRKKLIEITA